MPHDPSVTSHYIGDEFYQSLVDDFTDWQSDALEVSDPGLREQCRMVLEKEARLLDQNRLDDWLSLYAAECLYWVPATQGGGDPRREIAVSFDDRRRLEDRIFRLQNDFAWSQQPASRTARLVSNVEVFSTGEPDIQMTRSAFLTTEFQAGDIRHYAGWAGHRLRWKDGGWEILVKQVNLINCDQNLRNPSIVL
jgi:3-phenylpropionate/cinnamic acid dioxygenase small subunit